MATDISSPFAFIHSDVTRQLELSRNMVDELREIDLTIKSLEAAKVDSEAVESLQRQRDRLLIIARELANNATETSSTASTVIANVTAKST